jgi:hypothetical protein
MDLLGKLQKNTEKTAFIDRLNRFDSLQISKRFSNVLNTPQLRTQQDVDQKWTTNKGFNPGNQKRYWLACSFILL